MVQVERQDPYAPPLANVSATQGAKARSRLTRVAIGMGVVIAWFVFAIAFRTAHFFLHYQSRFSDIGMRFRQDVSVDAWVLATAVLLLPFAAGFAWAAGRLLGVAGPLNYALAVAAFLFGCSSFQGTPTTEPGFVIVFALLAAAAIASMHRWRAPLPMSMPTD